MTLAARPKTLHERLRRLRYPLLGTALFDEITLDSYFDMKEWIVEMRTAPDLKNPEEVKAGAQPVIGHKIVFLARRRMIGGHIY